MNIFDTIVARITPEGESAVSVIRLSGDKSFLCLKNLTGKEKFTPKKAMLVKIKLPSGISDKAVAVCYPKNRSYTGEDVCELSLHGNDYLVEKAIQACVESGARTAQRGEFTLRAFLNGKMDLTQAESVLSLIKSSNEKALKRAGSSAEGKTSGKVKKAIDSVDFCRAELEVCALEDTSNPFLTDAFFEKMSETEKDLGKLLSWSQAGKRDLHKPQVFIVGPPNAGKSTLFNRLFGSKRVVVSEIPGTTRDMIREDIVLQKGLVRLVDGAGFRERNDDNLETMGRELYLEKFNDADLFILLLDSSSDWEKEIQGYINMTKGKNSIIALNKSDLAGNSASIPEGAILISALKGENLEALKQRIESEIWDKKNFSKDPDDEAYVSERASLMITSAKESFKNAQTKISEDLWDIASFELLKVKEHLSAVIGLDVKPGDVVGLFDKFCVGK